MAAQPPRPPPNNLLFCGPPPALPHVLLLPSDATRTTLHSESDALDHTNDVDALHEINNVGVPTCGSPFNQVNNCVFEKVQNAEYQLPPESYVRRTHSFDITDIYTTHIENHIDSSAFRHRRSEPDLSKYGLFIEAEVTMECEPMQPALVLNNPFYDGTYAMDPSQLTQTMVVLPENYLAFEDSFVPMWDYKPEYLINGEINPEMYYDGLPSIPSNDPWSTYCNDNSGFEYYPSNYEVPEQDGVNYIPLADLEYAVPQYMSLPIVEQANLHTGTDANNYQSDETVTPNVDIVRSCETITNIDPNFKSDLPNTSVVVNNFVSKDEKGSELDSCTNRVSSSRSEESLNADISNDVTSSLAFVPTSKSSQRPHDGDDTSDDTSTCSTDYHEASALDLVQSLDELSRCDSTDFSQSRDDTSPVVSDAPKPCSFVTNENDKNHSRNSGLNTLVSDKSSSKLPLSELPSIPTQDRKLVKLPPESEIRTGKNISDKNVSQALTSKANNTQELHNHDSHKQKPNESIVNQVSEQVTENPAIKTNGKNNNSKIASPRQPPHQPPHPPAVPTSWLASRLNACNSSSSSQHPPPPPQIRVQNADGLPADFEKSPKPPSQSTGSGNLSTAVEPQPSCSFAPPQQPLHATQLKPEKQQKEVEVSQHFFT